MGWKARSTLVLASLALAAFAPPQVKREQAQQEQQKSWIPERNQDKDQSPVAPSDPPSAKTPRLSSAYRHPEGAVCSPAADSAPMKVKKEFVDSYMGAKAAVDAGRYEDAIALAELAAGYSHDARQWVSVEGIRIVAFSNLKNDAELVAALEAVLSLAGCIPAAQIANYQEILDAARQRVAPP
jgi:hypothetical protein